MTSCGLDFWELVDEADLSYVYLREGAGSLNAAALQNCEGLRRLYMNEGVSIWLIENKDQ